MRIERNEYEPRLQDWERKTPWFRRISARTGLQGKLVLSFMFLLVVTLGASSVQFVKESREVTEEVLAPRRRRSPARWRIGAESALQRGDAAELAAMGRKVLASRDIVGLAFFNPAGSLLSSSWLDGDPGGARARGLTNPRDNFDQSFRVRPRNHRSSARTSR
jgi:hypothetical protein